MPPADRPTSPELLAWARENALAVWEWLEPSADHGRAGTPADSLKAPEGGGLSPQRPVALT
jgi:hypothetical protein